MLRKKKLLNRLNGKKISTTFSMQVAKSGGKYDKQFYCQNCDYFADRMDAYERHCLTRKHTTSLQKVVESGGDCCDDNQIFYCENCDFKSSRNDAYCRHLKTQKHLEKVKGESHSSYTCQNCSKIFTTHIGFNRHVKKCQESNTISNMNPLLQSIIKDNQDFKNIVLELCKTVQLSQATIANTNIQNISNTTVNNNNNNNTFNLNLFLNETCKDAMNLSDFIKGVKVSIDDIEHIGKVGYVDGLSDLIIKNLNELGVERRPIHCTDAKRQIVYVKEDNKWEKEDDSMTRLKKMVCGVQQANFVTLKKWREIYPSCLTANSIYTDTYNTMSQELMGGDCEKVSLSAKELKIISKVAKGMTIDKTGLVIAS